MLFHCPSFRLLLGHGCAGRVPRKGLSGGGCLLENIPRVKVCSGEEKAVLDCEVISMKLPTNSTHITDVGRDDLR